MKKYLILFIVVLLTACSKPIDRVEITGVILEIEEQRILIENEELGFIWFTIPEDNEITLIVDGVLKGLYDGTLKESYPYQGTLLEIVSVEVLVIEEPVYFEPEYNFDFEEAKFQETSNTFQELGTCYEIFPISFADSDGDGQGDINGIRENLDYFTELGVTCLWITPVNESPSYHKYDVVDYYTIDPLFGTNEDYYALLEETESLGIKVFMDFVVNHTSKQHPWFTEHPEYYRWIEPGIPHYNYTDWHKDGDNYYYGSFWDQMPDLNLDSPDVREEIYKIAEFWIDKGVDGYRLDAALHFFDVHEYPHRTPTSKENVNFLMSLNERVKAVNPNAMLLTEVWAQAATVSRFYNGTDSSFNFDLSQNIIDTINQASDSSSIDMIGNLIEYRETVSIIRPDFVDSIFLTNHDQERIMSQVASESKAMLAANMLFTLPGVSWIYYGEEIGMWGVNPHENIRQPFIWDNEYQTSGSKTRGLNGENLSILPYNYMYDHYKMLIEMKTDPVLRYGDILEVEKNQRSFVAYVRSYEDTHYLVIHNLSINEQTATINQDFELVYDLGYYVDLSEGITIAPHGSIVVEVQSEEVTFTY